jgi:hypothetical protein
VGAFTPLSRSDSLGSAALFASLAHV